MNYPKIVNLTPPYFALFFTFAAFLLENERLLRYNYRRTDMRG